MMVLRTLYLGGSNLSMKMKIAVEIENTDGLKEIKPIVIYTEIPARVGKGLRRSSSGVFFSSSGTGTSRNLSNHWNSFRSEKSCYYR